MGFDLSHRWAPCAPVCTPDQATTSTTTGINKSLPRFALCSFGVEEMRKKYSVFFVLFLARMFGAQATSVCGVRLRPCACAAHKRVQVELQRGECCCAPPVLERRAVGTRDHRHVVRHASMTRVRSLAASACCFLWRCP